MNVTNELYFYLESSKIQGRIDPQYYNLNITDIGSLRLREVVEISGGKRLPEGFSFATAQTSFLYFSVCDMPPIGEDIEWNKVRSISRECFEKLKNYELRNGDVIISIAGTVGKVAIIENIPKGRRVVLTENCAKLQILNKHKLSSCYLFLLLNTSIITKQMDREKATAVISKLSLNKLSKIVIPTIANRNVQERIEKEYLTYKDEGKKVAERLESLERSKRKELMALLYPQRTEVVTKRELFTYLESKAIYGRGIMLKMLFDQSMGIVNYNEAARLSDIAVITRGDSLNMSEVVDGKYKVVSAGRTSKTYHNTQNFKGNNITVSASGGFAGCVQYQENPFFATSDCLVIYSCDENRISTKYIYINLMLRQNEIYAMQHGAAQPHINVIDMKKVSIPLISISAQQHIEDIYNKKHMDMSRLQKRQKLIENKIRTLIDNML